MKLSIHLSRGSAVALALSTVGASASAQTAPTPTREIGTVTVTDTAIGPSEAATSYKVSRTVGAMRTDTPLVDVPQAINIVTVRQIDDQAINGIADALRYVPGVFAAI